MDIMNKKDDDNLGSFYMGRTRASVPPKRYFSPGIVTIVALLVFAGILWYAYPRGAEKYRDMDVPVVKADTAPIKAEPVDPGGMEVRHQDSTVFDPLEKNAAAPVEKLLPAQEEPINKDLDIKPMAATDVKKTETAAPAQTDSKKVAAKGDTYIQLGAFRDVAAAKKAWQQLKGKYPQLLGSLEMKTERTVTSGKTLYRLQAGKMEAARAKEICTALKADKMTGCIPVKG